MTRETAMKFRTCSKCNTIFRVADELLTWGQVTSDGDCSRAKPAHYLTTWMLNMVCLFTDTSAGYRNLQGRLARMRQHGYRYVQGRMGRMRQHRYRYLPDLRLHGNCCS